MHNALVTWADVQQECGVHDELRDDDGGKADLHARMHPGEGMLEQRLHLGEDASVPFALAWLRINELSVLTSAVRW
jgi:hypothetical protein